VTAALDELLRTLLHEGCAAETDGFGAAQNGTAAPLGVLYPAAYARANPHVHADLRLEIAVQASEASSLSVNVLFLEPPDRGIREVAVTPAEIGDFVRKPRGESRNFLVPVRACVQASRIGASLYRIRVDVANETGFEDAAVPLDRGAALHSSLLSTHVVLRVSPGRFVSPVETRGVDGEAARGCTNRNVWPVLFGRSDDTAIGAALVLPDHPEIAPEIRRLPFDGQDGDEGNGARFRRGDKVRLVLARADEPYDVLLDGRTATLERIYRGADASVHYAVSLDDDPGRDLVRDTGRLFYFRSNEVEALSPLSAPNPARLRA